MTFSSKSPFALFLPALVLASCANANSGESAASADYTVETMGMFAEPWAIEFAPGTGVLFITEKAGVLKVMDTST
ncbi:MAG: PQQ-dependent sugar dehydrogenase, partial [Pseudomonadota bacterium]